MASAQIPALLRQASAADFVAKAAGGTVRLYQAADPGTPVVPDPDGAYSGLLLCTITLGSPGYGSVLEDSAGSYVDIEGTPEANAAADGVAYYARLYTVGGTCFWQTRIFTSGSDGFVIADNTLVNGNPVKILSHRVHFPKGTGS